MRKGNLPKLLLTHLPGRIRILYKLSLLCLLMLAGQAKAIIYTVGTGTTSSTTSGVTPFTTLYEDSRVQYLYLASELTAAGASAGLIQSVGFNFTYLGSPSPTNVNIKIGTTTATIITGITAGLSVHYSAASVSPVLGWNTFAFSPSFLWNGTDNILIEVCTDNTTWNDNYGVETFQFPTGDTRTFGYYDDGATGCTMTSGNTASATNRRRRPNAQFDIVPAISCSGQPSPGTISGPTSVCSGIPFTITSAGATVGVGLTYEWQWSPVGAGVWTTISGAGGTTLTLSSGQAAATDYRLVVTCSNGGGFDNSNVLTVGLNAPAACYCTPVYVDGCTYDDDLNTFILVGENSTSFNDVGTGCSPGAYSDRTAQPAVQLAQGMLYSGDISSTYTFVYEYARIWIDLDDDGIFASTESVGTVGPFANTLVPFSITIPANAALGSHRMRVRVVYDEPAASIDPCISYDYGETHDYTVTIVTPPSCPAPNTLLAGSITSSGATASWTEAGTATQWRVEYGPSGFTPGTGTFVTATLTASAALSGLTANAAYSFYVRALCSGTDSSTQSGPYTFTTAQVPVAPPYAQNWESGGTDWTFVNGTQPNKWVSGTAVSNTGLGSLYISNDGGLTNSYDINAASVVHAYRDLDLSALSSPVPVDFNWRGMGEVGWDYLDVWVVPTSFVPVAGTEITASSGGVQLVPELSNQSSFTAANLSIPVSFTGGTARLVFQWIDDTNTGTNPPAAIDNLTIGGAPLAISLLSFTGYREGAVNRLNWETAKELKGEWFELERSADGTNFKMLAHVDAKGKPGTYAFTDEHPVMGRNHYRLKMMDRTGAYNYSRTVTIGNTGTESLSVEAFPNPVKDQLTIRVNGKMGANAAVLLTDVNGRIVLQAGVTGNETSFSTEGLAKDVYLLKYRDDAQSRTIKITKQ